MRTAGKAHAGEREDSKCESQDEADAEKHPESQDHAQKQLTIHAQTTWFAFVGA